MPVDEVVIETWANIAKMFGVPVDRMRRYREELMDCGAVFYKKKRVGRGHTRTVAAFPSSLRLWAAMRGRNRDPI